MARTQIDCFAPVPQGGAAIAAEGIEHGGVSERDGLAEGMAQSPGRLDCLGGVSVRGIAIAPVPGEMAEVRAAKDADLGAREQRQNRWPHAAGCTDGHLHMGKRFLQATEVKQAAAQDEVARLHQLRRPIALGGV